MSAPASRLTALLTPVVAELGCDLEALSVSPAGRRRVVRVVVDRDGGVSLDDVADVSRRLSEALDDIDAREPEVLGGAYVLEVSSPGVDRPLTEGRHWRRNAQRLVVAHLADGTQVRGRVLRADDAEVVLDVDGAERVLPLAEVRKGLVQVEFDRKGAAEDGAAGDEDDVHDEDAADEADDDLHDEDGDVDDEADESDESDESDEEDGA